jgi:hypothetical protein
MSLREYIQQNPADREARLACGHVIEYEQAASGHRFAGATAYCPVHEGQQAIAAIKVIGGDARPVQQG